MHIIIGRLYYIQTSMVIYLMHKMICKYYFRHKSLLFLGYKSSECYFSLIQTFLCLLRSIISTSKELSVFKSAFSGHFQTKLLFIIIIIIKRENKNYFFRMYF